MRVVYLNPSGQLGGAEAALLEIMASVREAEPKWSVDLIVAAEGLLASRARRLGVRTIVLPFPAALARLGDSGARGPAGNEVTRSALLSRLLSAVPSTTVYVKRLRRVLRELTADVLHTNGFKMHLLGAWARPPAVPIIWHVHDYVQARPIMSRLLRRNSWRCSAAVANSKGVADDLRSLCRGRLKVHVVYNGVNLERFCPTGPALDLDALAGMSPAGPGTLRVGLIATFARWKGHATFLEALALLPPDAPVRGYVIGGPVYQTDGSQYSVTELRRLAVDLRIADRVGFTGFVEEPAAAMRALDIVVHASIQPEPFGLVIAEAMACGRAVITSATGGATELIDVPRNALDYRPGDAGALARSILDLTTDAELRATLGRAGRETAEARFDRRRLGDELIPIYGAVTRSNGGM